MGKFLSQLPAILLAILVFIAGIFAIKLFSKVVTKFIDEKSKDSIVTDFLVNIVSFILTIFWLSFVWGFWVTEILLIKFWQELRSPLLL